MLLYAVLLILLLTLMPYQFIWPDQVQWMLIDTFSDVIKNLFLFLPIGFLYALAHPQSTNALYSKALLFGFLLSCSVELLQLLLHNRYSTGSDVISNTLGSLIGVFAYQKLQKQLKTDDLSRLMALEYPLMFDIYLLTFLIWLNGSTLSEEPSRLALLPLLALLGARIFGSVLAYQATHTHRAQLRQKTFFITLLWFAIAAVPALFQNPYWTGMVVLAVAFLATQQLHRLQLKPAPERRFEIRTLKPALPILLLYLFLLTFWPLHFSSQDWHLQLVWAETMPFSDGIQFRIIELFVGFTLLGFFISECHGRQQISALQQAAYQFSYLLLSLLTLTLLHGFHLTKTVQGVELLIFSGGYFSGLMLYHLQQQQIKAILSLQRK
ncbi:MAG: VanZ family protein [Gammaproteobacteria bacterium]|nr:VanZ family protein [Gammaproteobacteria bacterium]